MRVRPASPIPLFDRKPVNPSVPIGVCAAITRSVGQGRPQAGARALPLAEASMMACSRPFGGGAHVRRATITAIMLVMTGASIVTAFAAPVRTQDAPRAATAAADPYAIDIAEASRRFGIPEAWIRAVMHVESRGNVRAVSPKGAIGLMQIMPDTWTGLRRRYGFGHNPRDPRDNILAGAAYLREMHDRYGAAGFLAAYNAGPGRYQDYVSTGRPLPAETRAYVAALAPLIGGGGLIDRSVAVAAGPNLWIRAPLFVGIVDSTLSTDRPQSDSRLHTRSVADLSGLEPSLGWRLGDKPRSASLFVARASGGRPR
jgi:soluble lytic murein transglycosylase-like protein